MIRRLRGRWHVREWPLWHNPAWVSMYVVAVTCGYLAAVAAALAARPFALHYAGLFAFLVTFGIFTVEVTRRNGEPSGMVKDAHGVWYLSVALLLPPLYALLAPVPLWLLTQFRVRRGLVYRRVFSVAAIGLSVAAASWVFHAAAPVWGLTGGSSFRRPLLWLAIAAGCALARSAVNRVLVVVPIKGTEPTASVRHLLLDREVLQHELAEICIAALVAFAVAQVPAALLLALPFGSLLQRSVRHTQLVSEARVDGKTGMLNAATWNREAFTHITRAVRAGTALALAIVDIDHFKQVNDRYGHLTGDRVLLAVTGAIRATHRGSDLCGRFGGEEFVLLLPDTSAAEAGQVAERLRANVAALRVLADEGGESAPIRVTVSVGVATLGASCWQLTDLMAAADAALYYAKETGRNRVRLSPAGSEPAASWPSAGDPPGLMTGQD